VTLSVKKILKKERNQGEEWEEFVIGKKPGQGKGEVTTSTDWGLPQRKPEPTWGP